MIEPDITKLTTDLAKYFSFQRNHKNADLEVKSPINGTVIAKLKTTAKAEIEKKISLSINGFEQWKNVPAPKRGELIRLFGNELRAHKTKLAQLVSLECGKNINESEGEVQEMIDICDFAAGLSRTIAGLTLPSERPLHVMQENWLPLGVVAVISAFNFPVAVWAWNFALAIICGDSVIWKPSEKTTLCAMATITIFDKALKNFNHPAAQNICQLVIGGKLASSAIINNSKIALISATGSSNMGKAIAPIIASRLGKSLLELGGNNAIIVSRHANIDIALSAILFGATGTCGQRCTTTRRAIIHEEIYDTVHNKLKKLYKQISTKIGNPLTKTSLIGPLIDENAYNNMQNALKMAKNQGGKIIGGKRILDKKYPHAYYVEPALVDIGTQTGIVMEETFAPILYLIRYKTIEQALTINNQVAAGLSSAIFTNLITEAEFFKQNSDCGIANVNIGTSGAEIGGAFGGEKETGGGREAGSDVWKNYMRRQTSTTYYGTSVPALAQGVIFEL